MSNTVQQAVNFKHFRNFNYGGWDYMDRLGASGKGGVTMAYRHLTEEEHVANDLIEGIEAVFVGFAACSIADNYDKKLGRTYASQRLATSKNIYAGDIIEELIHNDDLAEVEHLLSGAMLSQGLRVELCRK